MDEQPIINESQTNIETQKTFEVNSDLVKEWNDWFLRQKYSLDSSLSYLSYLKKFVGFGIEINQKNVDKFRQENFNSVSSSALKSFFKFLVNVKEFPIEILNIHFERNKQTRKLPQTISYDEVQLIINGMETLKDKLMTMLMYELALRITEALKLKWTDFNWSEWIKDKTQYGKVELKDTKRGKFRVIPVKPELMNILYENHSKRNDVGIPIGELLFERGSGILSYEIVSESNNKNKRFEKDLAKKLGQHDYLDYAKRMYRRELDKVSEEKLGKKIKTHSLRHSKAQHLLNSGMSIESLKEFLGHSSISTTEIYAQASPEKVKKELIKYDIKEERKPEGIL